MASIKSITTAITSIELRQRSWNYGCDETIDQLSSVNVQTAVSLELCENLKRYQIKVFNMMFGLKGTMVTYSWSFLAAKTRNPQINGQRKPFPYFSVSRNPATSCESG
jgi:hypothetical protein